ncbi:MULTISPECIES: hypothetical protein [Rhodanobacter]|uniref:hypothetical protein n=1 Tax=Rhodanobacter TaxID=75309 RepID=UPI0003F4F57B|nr:MULTISPECIES: hypothetical protein [Rhodanobacter]TAN19624.1 MAG: hypothetical protein EPN35_00635 [Rhodanobacter sp.]UJJ54881.1 hypothetical protein LRK53_00295 [Rhodanobacter thiooxydans]
MLAACLLEKDMPEPVMTDVRSTGKPVWIVYLRKQQLSARVQAFIEWVRELFEHTSQPGQHMAGAPKAASKPLHGKALVEAA